MTRLSGSGTAHPGAGVHAHAAGDAREATTCRHRLADPGRSVRSRSRVPGPLSGRHRQSGYTLIEVIVAFALLALALTLLLGTLSGSARQVRQSADAGQATLYAQSLLDEAGVGVALQPGQREGEFANGRYRWTLDVQPYNDPARPPSPLVDPAAAQLLLLSLSVEWGDAGPAQRMRLQSLRLVAPDVTAAPP